MLIHGILAIEEEDATGETLLVNGTDLNPINKYGRLYFEGSFEWGLGVGPLFGARVISGRCDCRSDVDRGLYDLARGRPFIKVRGEVRDAGIAECLRQGIEAKEAYFGAIGMVLERSEPGGRTLKSTIIRSALVTMYPVHRAQRIFLGSGE